MVMIMMMMIRSMNTLDNQNFFSVANWTENYFIRQESQGNPSGQHMLMMMMMMMMMIVYVRMYLFMNDPVNVYFGYCGSYLV